LKKPATVSSHLSLDTLKKQANPSDPEMPAAARKNLERFVRKGWQSASRINPEAELEIYQSKPPLQNPEVFDPPGKDITKWLKKLEKAAGGPTPISLRAWFEQGGASRCWARIRRSAQSQYQRRRSLHYYHSNACADAEFKFEWHQTTFVK
jgi:hypothetical protein